MNIRRALLVTGALLLGSTTARAIPTAPPTVQSQSGQFIISAPAHSERNPLAAIARTNRQWIEIEPALLVVSCERVKQAVARHLGVTAPWRGRIHVGIVPAESVEDGPSLAADRFRDDWVYRLGVPDVVERNRLMRGLVQVVLLESANRRAGERSAELPAWLVVGLTEQLLAESEAELLFAPPRKEVGGLKLDSTVVLRRQSDERAALHARLREQAPLTLQELSWPDDTALDGPAAAAYRVSAQVFVGELLRLKGGPACFRAFLEELPRHLNWQTAFLKAFRPHFERLLDLEKWWGLQVAYLGGRDLLHAWPPAESWRKLEEVIRVPVQVRASTNDLSAVRESVSLQTVVHDWPRLRQTPVLRARLQQLELLCQRVAPEVLPLAEDYRRVLAHFLTERDKQGAVVTRGPNVRPGLVQLISLTVRQLDALDARLASARGEQPPPAAR